jgi:hypothetical protein
VAQITLTKRRPGSRTLKKRYYELTEHRHTRAALPRLGDAERVIREPVYDVKPSTAL